MWNRVVNKGYSVLQTARLNKADRTYAATILEQLNSGVEAEIRAGRDGFGYKFVDPTGRVGVLTYKGIEVAVFFKRTVEQIPPCSADPVPEDVLLDPQGAWLRVSLLEEKGSRVKAKAVLTALESELRDEKVLTENLTKEVKRLRDDLDYKKSRVQQLESDVRQLKKDLVAAVRA